MCSSAHAWQHAACEPLGMLLRKQGQSPSCLPCFASTPALLAGCLLPKGASVNDSSCWLPLPPAERPPVLLHAFRADCRTLLSCTAGRKQQRCLAAAAAPACLIMHMQPAPQACPPSPRLAPSGAGSARAAAAGCARTWATSRSGACRAWPAGRRQCLQTSGGCHASEQQELKP